MKKVLLIALSVLLAVAAVKTPQQKYIDTYSSIAVSEMKRTGVPASITLAQGMLESNSGQSALAVKGNNHFGIKCHNDWTGKRQYRDDDASRECFRVYPKAENSFADHSDFLRGRDRYKSLFDLDATDYKAWAKGLKAAGYATDPAYASKLIKLIEDYELYRFDEGVGVEIESPTEIEEPRELTFEEVRHNYKESVKFSMHRQIFTQNGVPFVYAREGETWASIASANGLFLKELLRFNDLAEEEPLRPGAIVYLARKKSQAAEGLSRYVVEDGTETLYSIAQRYGIRLAPLQKMNPQFIGRSLEEGDSIKLRRK